MGPSHEGYWAGDKFALIEFREAMKAKYEKDLGKLNAAWGTSHAGWDEVTPPREIGEPFKPNPVPMDTVENRRRWLDFITWYHQALIDFAEKSVQVTLKHFPKEKVRTKPGGNAGGVNPIAWGTYSPGFAKMAGNYGIVMQPADCHGAYFGDKWIGTSYQFYGVPLATEPASLLDEKGFVRRIFSDASSGAAQLFTYEFERHAGNIRKYVHLYTGKRGDTEIALMCPTTLYRLGGDLGPTIQGGGELRDLVEYDVLDELLITDGALTDKYKVLIVLQPDFVEDRALERIDDWKRAGGTLVLVGHKPMKNLAGLSRIDMRTNIQGEALHVPAINPNGAWLRQIGEIVAGMKGVDGKLDVLMTCRRGEQVFIFNASDRPTAVTIDLAGATADIVIEPHTIWSNR